MLDLPASLWLPFRDTDPLARGCGMGDITPKYSSSFLCPGMFSAIALLQACAQDQA
jgi:hypothetical protein